MVWGGVGVERGLGVRCVSVHGEGGSVDLCMYCEI